MKRKQNKSVSGVVYEAAPDTATGKPFYADNPRYVYISLSADPSEVVTYLKQYGNSAAMIDLKRELPQMVSVFNDSTSLTDSQSAELPISKGA